MTPRDDAWRWSALLALFAAGWAGFFYLHPEHLAKIGIGHYRIETAPQQFHEIWFLDTFAILAANDAVTAGRDPYASNPLDYMRRPHVYGPWWLHLRHFGLTRADVRGVGFALGAAFLLAAVAMLRPRTPGELLWSTAFLCSTPVLSGLERGNNDLLIFLLLAPVVPCLLSVHAPLRWLAMGLLALATELKIYPAVAFVVLLAPVDRAERRLRVAIGSGLLAVIAWHLAVSTVPFRSVTPLLGGVFSFGAEIVVRELGFTGRAVGWTTLVLGGVCFVAAWRSPWLRGWTPAPAQTSAWLRFILAAALLAGCFFAGQHFGYRWIWALGLAPFLWALRRDTAAPPPVRRLARTTAVLLLGQLWLESLAVLTLHGLSEAVRERALRAVWLGMQPVTWALMACLSLFLAHFVRKNFRGLRE